MGTGDQRYDLENVEHVKSLPEQKQNIQNTSRQHQRFSRNSQKDFFIHSLRKSSPSPKGTRPPGGLIELQSPSDSITHTGAIQISRFNPPTSDASLR